MMLRSLATQVALHPPGLDIERQVNFLQEVLRPGVGRRHQSKGESFNAQQLSQG